MSDAGSGCFGCLLETVGFLGIIYIATHLGAIWAVVTGAVR